MRARARAASRGRATSERPPAPLRATLAAIAGVAALVAAGYALSLDAPFVLDDLPNIRDAPSMHVETLDAGALARAVREAPTPARPVANLTFALNHAAGGLDPRGYRLVNVAIHALNGVLVYLLALATLRTPGAGERGRAHAAWIAAAAAWIFVAHPVQVQAVTYVVQRMTSLATAFGLLALLLYAAGRAARGRARRAAALAGAALAWLLALGSKEIAAVLPLMAFTWEWYFLRDLDRAWLRRALPLAAALGLALAAAVLVHLGADPIARIAGAYAGREFGPLERLLTEARVVVLYLGLIAWPAPDRLSLVHDPALSRSLLDPPSTLAAIALLALLAVAAVLAARRWRIASFAVVWLGLALVIESTVIPLELAFEHRLYLPMLGPALLAAWGVHRIAPPRAAIAILACACVALAAATHVRNRAWSDEVTLWRDAAAKAPGSYRARYNLANALARRGRLDAAIVEYRRAVEARPEAPEARTNLGRTLLEAGRAEAAVEALRAALAADPAHASAWTNLGIALARRGRLDDAEAAYRRSIELAPGNANAWHDLANLLARRGDAARAIAAWREALGRDPDLVEARVGLGAALAGRGDLAAAVREFRAALARAPAHAGARVNLAQALAALGDLEGACRALARVRDVPAPARGFAAALRERCP